MEITRNGAEIRVDGKILDKTREEFHVIRSEIDGFGEGDRRGRRELSGFRFLILGNMAKCRDGGEDILKD